MANLIIADMSLACPVACECLLGVTTVVTTTLRDYSIGEKKLIGSKFGFPSAEQRLCDALVTFSTYRAQKSPRSVTVMVPSASQI